MDETGRGVIATVNDSDIYWINADIGYIQRWNDNIGGSGEFPECNSITINPFSTVALFDGCDDEPASSGFSADGIILPSTGLVGTHSFGGSFACVHHPGGTYDFTWSVTFG